MTITLLTKAPCSGTATLTVQSADIGQPGLVGTGPLFPVESQSPLPMP